MAPPLDWIAEAARRLDAPDATVAGVAAWAGGDAAAGADEVLLDRPPAAPGALNLRIAGPHGRPGSLSAWYARDEGPTLADAEGALGAWEGWGPPGAGPYQGTFAGAPPGWRLIGTLHDPPAAGARLVEVALLRA